jgi:hypothetical protein
MIPLWKGKNPIYFGVIRSKVKVTITINRIFDNRVVSTFRIKQFIKSCNWPPKVYYSIIKTRNVCIKKYAHLYKLSNGKKLYL